MVRARSGQDGPGAEDIALAATFRWFSLSHGQQQRARDCANGLTVRSLRGLTCRYAGNTINFGVHLGRRESGWPRQAVAPCHGPRSAPLLVWWALHEAVAEPTVSALAACARAVDAAPSTAHPSPPGRSSSRICSDRPQCRKGRLTRRRLKSAVASSGPQHAYASLHSPIEAMTCMAIRARCSFPSWLLQCRLRWLRRPCLHRANLGFDRRPRTGL